MSEINGDKSRFNRQRRQRISRRKRNRVLLELSTQREKAGTKTVLKTQKKEQ